MSRTLWPLATLAMLAVIVAGCGNGSAGTGNSTAATHEKAVKFAECMRANGVSEFPGPGGCRDARTPCHWLACRPRPSTNRPPPSAAGPARTLRAWTAWPAAGPWQRTAPATARRPAAPGRDEATTSPASATTPTDPARAALRSGAAAPPDTAPARTAPRPARRTPPAALAAAADAARPGRTRPPPDPPSPVGTPSSTPRARTALAHPRPPAPPPTARQQPTPPLTQRHWH